MAQLFEAYNAVLFGGEKSAEVVLDNRTVKIQRENAGDSNKFDRKIVAVYIDGKKQEETAVVLGVYGILSLLNPEPTATTAV